MSASSENNSKRSLATKHSRETLSRKHSERHQVMQIQNYIIYRKTIGAGSMGKVKLAECLTDVEKKKYAVKIMPKIDLEAVSTKSKDPKDTPEEREQRTIREMAIMRLLRHPNICQLKEYITEGDKYYMFLEYIDGGQLLDYIVKHGKLKEKQARKFARQIVSALDYCHRNSIVHRDLKIENILITRSEQLKIIDFGLSNTYSPTQQLDTFCGSLYFAAPELLKAKEYTGPEVDVWSFGVVLYVLVCGKVPFDDTNLPALHEKIKSGVVEEYPDHLGKDCIDLLTRIFVVNPSKRITLSDIRTHVWMNKGYEEPIRNYLPHRQPIDTIDMELVKGMNGFGLGSPEEIKEKLSSIISSPAYQSAASQIDQNFVKKETDDQQYASRPRWRRSLSTRKRTIEKDDFRSLPAMYDPLISIYYLVKERKESEERKQKLLNAEPNASGLSRSASTSTRVTAVREKSGPTTLTRRRTYDASKKLPDLPPPSTPIPSKSEKTASRRLLRKKSLQQAAKMMGINLDPKPSHKKSAMTQSTHSVPTSPRKSNWLKLELNSQSAAKLQQPKASTMLQPRKSTESVTKSGWKRLSVKSSRFSFDNNSSSSSGNLEKLNLKKSNSTTSTTRQQQVPSPPPPLVLEKSKSEVLKKSSPKSIFQFNHAHLFRIPPRTMMNLLLDATYRLRIEALPTQDEFKLKCKHNTLDFYIIVYEARLAGGKIGFKLKDETHHNKQALRDLYRLLLSDIIEHMSVPTQ